MHSPSIPRSSNFWELHFSAEESVLRLLQSADELDQWKQRIASGDYGKYLGSIDSPPFASAAPWFGSLEIAAAGQLDVAVLFEHSREVCRDWTIDRGRVYYPELGFSKNAVEWRGYTAKAVVFCEGYKLSENPFFKSIQLNPAKGEILTLRAPSFSDDRISSVGNGYSAPRRPR